MGRFITIAHVVKTYGKNGAVIAKSARKLNEKRLSNLEVFIAPPLLERPTVRVTKALVKGKRLILFFEGIEDISEAETLKGRYLQASESVINGLFDEEGNEYTGFKCVTSTGVLIGTVTDILINPAHRVFVVKRDKKEILIPDVPEYVESVNEKTGIIIIKEESYIKNWKDDA